MIRRLFSSDEVIAALQRGGFALARNSSGSHSTYKRKRPDGTHDVTVVARGYKTLPRATLHSVLTMANVTEDEFLRWAKVRRKGQAV